MTFPATQRAYSSLKSLTPRSLRGALGAAVEELGALTSTLRLLPSFIIVGGQRCGTNSLYEYVASHPRVGRALPLPEVHYFDLNFERGMEWYRGHFPIRLKRRAAGHLPHVRSITGESSPYYMFHPLAAPRIAAALPRVKLIVLLRNPIDRAYSHYNHEQARGHEALCFEDALEQEPERLAGEAGKLRANAGYRSFSYQHFSYLARGMYADQLERIFSLFPRDDVLVLGSEELFLAPVETHMRVLEFLGLSAVPLRQYPQLNPGTYSGMDGRLRRQLADHFSGPNERLSRLIGRDVDWD